MQLRGLYHLLDFRDSSTNSLQIFFSQSTYYGVCSCKFSLWLYWFSFLRFWDFDVGHRWNLHNQLENLKRLCILWLLTSLETMRKIFDYRYSFVNFGNSSIYILLHSTNDWSSLKISDLLFFSVTIAKRDVSPGKSYTPDFNLLGRSSV